MSYKSTIGLSWAFVLRFVLLVSTSCSTLALSFDEIGVASETGSHNYTEILEGLLENYDKRLRPNYGGPPVDVKVGLFVEDIFSVDETQMEVSMTVFVRQVWEDPRLTFDGDKELVLKGDEIELFWSPDLFFLYEINAWYHDVTVLNKALYIYPSGHMFKSQRLSVVTGCPMKFHKFPRDDQQCTIQLVSYAYSIEHLTLSIPEGAVVLDPEIYIPAAFHLSHEKPFESFVSKRKYVLGNFSCAGVTFHFERYWQAYMLTVYLPSYLLVIIAWLSFFIDSKSAPARVSLGVTTVLTMTTLMSSMVNSLPQVTYTKSIDIWLAACLVFIFAALVEYAVASQLNCHQERKQSKKTEKWRSSLFELRNNRRNSKVGINNRGFRPGESCDSDSKIDLEAAEEAESQPKEYDLIPLWLMPAMIKHSISSRCTSRNLDFHSRWIFLISFAIFNVVYWVVTSGW